MTDYNTNYLTTSLFVSNLSTQNSITSNGINNTGTLSNNGLLAVSGGNITLGGGNLQITTGTNSTSPSTGDIVLSGNGGIGCGGNIYSAQIMNASSGFVSANGGLSIVDSTAQIKSTDSSNNNLFGRIYTASNNFYNDYFGSYNLRNINNAGNVINTPISINSSGVINAQQLLQVSNQLQVQSASAIINKIDYGSFTFSSTLSANTTTYTTAITYTNGYVFGSAPKIFYSLSPGVSGAVCIDIQIAPQNVATNYVNFYVRNVNSTTSYTGFIINWIAIN